MKIITNNRPRAIIYFNELTEKEQTQFDYCEGEGSFFRYRGNVYDLGEFMKIEHAKDLSGWDGYSSDTYFSGTLVKICDDSDYVIAGRYYS